MPRGTDNGAITSAGIIRLEMTVRLRNFKQLRVMYHYYDTTGVRFLEAGPFKDDSFVNRNSGKPFLSNL